MKIPIITDEMKTTETSPKSKNLLQIQQQQNDIFY